MKIFQSDDIDVSCHPEHSLRHELLTSCHQSLTSAVAPDDFTSLDEFEQWRSRVQGTIRSALPSEIFDRTDELSPEQVSTVTADSCTVENVVFESLPGWDVNASVYKPHGQGPFPGIVLPCGHHGDGKVAQRFQLPAQVFAKNGYITVSFDPPGRGEKRSENDHNIYGKLGYLTGFWSKAFFVADALRAVDYLEFRDDVADEQGVSITGVSGGGLTSLYTALLDDRVTSVAPVCCLTEFENSIQGCPEDFGPGLIAAGLWSKALVAALAPKACLIVAAAGDQLKPEDSTHRIYDAVSDVYEVCDVPDRVGLYIDQDSDHDYTLEMATAVVDWLNTHHLDTDIEPNECDRDELTLFDDEQLHCGLTDQATMYTINRDRAEQLRGQRNAADSHSIESLRPAIRELLDVRPPVKPLEVEEVTPPDNAMRGFVEDLRLRPTDDVSLPALMTSRLEHTEPNPGLLWLNETGRWTGFRDRGYLTHAAGITEDSCPPEQPRILSLDITGLGRLAPDPLKVDLTGFNDTELIFSCLSIANGHPILGLQVRDALCGLTYLAGRDDVDENRLIVGGTGCGALVALFVAATSESVRRVVTRDQLVSYQALVETVPHQWTPMVFIDSILETIDIPDLLAILANELTVSVITPRDANREPLDPSRVSEVYNRTIELGGDVGVPEDPEEAVTAAIQQDWQ